MCNEYDDDKKETTMIDLKLLTVAAPISQVDDDSNDKSMVCPISTVAPNIGYWVSMIVDSGAGESVSPSDAFMDYPVFETDASKSGLEYTAAGGHTIPNEGATQPFPHTLEGERRTMTFQVAEVTNILASVSRIVST